MAILVSAAAAIALLISAYGWGRGAEKLSGLNFAWPLTAGIGFAALVFAGGIANALFAATPLVVDGIWIIGLAIAVLSIIKDGGQTLFVGTPRDFVRRHGGRILPYGLIGALFVFAVVFYARPTLFNPFDDLEKYLGYPLRMLATGSVSSGPFSTLGSVSFLGGQAFLQGVLAANLPLGAVNILDNVAAYTLVLLVAARAAALAHYPKLIAPIVVLLAAFVNPQWVNVSANYTGALLCLLLLVLPGAAQGREDKLTPPGIASYGNAALIGLIYAALVALKTNLIVFAALHFAFISILALWQGAGFGRYLKWGAATGAASFLFILPWLAVHGRQWAATPPLRVPAGEARIAAQIPVAPAPDWPASYFDAAFYGFGESYFHYLILVAVPLALSLAVLALRRRDAPANALAKFSVVSSLTSFLFAAVFVGIIGMRMIGPDTGLRLAIPVLIAGTLGALIFAASMGRKEAIGAAIIGAGFVLMLAPSFGQRMVQAAGKGNIFAQKKLVGDVNFLRMADRALAPVTARKIREIQTKIPAGRTTLAWITTPFHLDYGRNPIFDVQKGGLRKRSNDFPFETDPAITKKYLKSLDIEYVILQVRGGTKTGTKKLIRNAQSPYSFNRRMAIRTLIFSKAMSELSKNSEILFRDSNYILFRISS